MTGEGGIILKEAFREYLIEEVILEPRLEEGEGASHVDI